SLMAGNAFQKGVELEQDADPDLRIYADPNMINTVIRNLISNAIKFTERGGKVKAKATDLGDYAEIIISDTGIGIEPEVRDRLFRIDTQSKHTGTAGEVGTGLGLIMVRELIEKHNGSIRVESELGKGSDFIITLPKNIPAEEG
ncbi:MAG: sensor histidine kinase, partial [Bacteroidota bacterium]